jgi:hypothetical protein
MAPVGVVVVPAYVVVYCNAAAWLLLGVLKDVGEACCKVVVVATAVDT